MFRPLLACLLFIVSGVLQAETARGDTALQASVDELRHAIGRWNTSSSHMQPISSISAVNWGDLTILGMNEIGILGMETSDGFALDPLLSQTTIE